MKLFKKIILSAIPILMISAPRAQAVPSLQLDIDGGIYVGSTIVTTDELFDVYAIGDSTYSDGDTAYFSVAILNADGSVVGDLVDFGDFTINGAVFDTSNTTFGTPPEDATGNPLLGGHSVFPTTFVETEFTFSGSNAIAEYNTQIDRFNSASITSSGTSLYESFQINTAGLNDGFILHFDLYTTQIKNGELVRDDFAPFSHDASTALEGGNAPLSTSAAAMSAAFIAVIGLRRRFA